MAVARRPAAARVEPGGDVDVLTAVHRLLYGLASIGSPALSSSVMPPLRRAAKVLGDRIPDRLRGMPQVSATGEVVRMRDVYGTRFAVIAGFEYRGHDRDPSVFLFDIDASGIIEVVGGGVHDDVEQAAQAWRTAVGDTAEDAVVEPVERSEDLMPLASRWRGRESISPPREGPASHSRWLGRRPGMFAAYLTITIVAAAINGSAAVFYLIGHDYPKSMVDMKRLPRSWIPVLGSVLAAGSLGLLAGLAVPLLGTLAAGGLVLYFVGALAAHLRVGSRKLVGWAVFFAVAVATLSVNLVYNA